MPRTEYRKVNLRKHVPLYLAVLVLLCLIINIAGTQFATAFSLPVFLDCLGTLLAAAFGGLLPGMITGFATNVITSYSDPINLYYGFISVLIAILTYLLYKHHWFKKLHTTLAAIGLYALLGGGIGSLVTWLLYGFGQGEGISHDLTSAIYDGTPINLFWSQMTADILIDILDKAIIVILFSVLIRVIPRRVRHSFRMYEDVKNGNAGPVSERVRSSLRKKVFILLAVAATFIIVTAVLVSYYFYQQSQIDHFEKTGVGDAKIAASYVDGDRVEDYLNGITYTSDYISTKDQLQRIVDNTICAEYVYVYTFEEDKMVTVFDVNSTDEEEEKAGDVHPFDVDFNEIKTELLNGDYVSPVVSHGPNGALLTAFEPVKDSYDRTVCYAAIDISLTEIGQDVNIFMIKVFTVFFGAFLIIISVTLWFTERNIIYPINDMADATGTFAYDTANDRDSSVNAIANLGIKTGDELENLYDAIRKMTTDTMGYIDDIKGKNEVITDMQEGLIFVLADMVESRDESTGDHVKKTTDYVGIILEELKRRGLYSDILTDEYIQNVQSAASLHDIGKITVSDTILNKPGRLTNEEYDIMKKHSAAGAAIIQKVIDKVPESAYLAEAKLIANYHHEWWNGKGYPEGLKGTDIPLSARVMAVADVFDALISPRCYKKAFTFDESIGIIKEESGTHFDPEIVDAFLTSAEEVRKVAQRNAEKASE